jgi:hypothetical protein
MALGKCRGGSEAGSAYRRVPWLVGIGNVSGGSSLVLHGWPLTVKRLFNASADGGVFTLRHPAAISVLAAAAVLAFVAAHERRVAYRRRGIGVALASESLAKAARSALERRRMAWRGVGKKSRKEKAMAARKAAEANIEVTYAHLLAARLLVRAASGAVASGSKPGGIGACRLSLAARRNASRGKIMRRRGLGGWLEKMANRGGYLELAAAAVSSAAAWRRRRRIG